MVLAIGAKHLPRFIVLVLNLRTKEKEKEKEAVED